MAVGERTAVPMIQQELTLAALNANGDSFETVPYVAEGFISLAGFVKSDQFTATPAGALVARVTVIQSMDQSEDDITQVFNITDADEVKPLDVPVRAKFVRVLIENLAAVASIIRIQLQFRRT